MNEVILHLRDGQSRAVAMPAGRELHDILHYMRVPADAAGKMVRLQVPGDAAIDLPATDIASLEIPPPHVLVPDFLTDAEQAQVLAFTLAHANAFQNSGAYDLNHSASITGRRSRILDGPENGVLAAFVMPKLQKLLPTLWSQLGTNPLLLDKMECQITAHGDGDFFSIHTDNGAPDIAHRVISYVYYFHREPKQFSGGHLCLYHTLVQGGYGKCGRLASDIEPPRNGLMVFPTYVYHAVSPISCASSTLTDQRLTMNGWLFR